MKLEITPSFKREILNLSFLLMADAIDGNIDFPERLASALETVARQIRAQNNAVVGLVPGPPSGIDQ